MKKVLSLLLVSVLAVGNVGFAATPVKAAAKPAVVAEVSKMGVVIGYTDTTVTVLENGKSMTYKLDAKTKVTSLGMEADFASVINKGLKLSFKAKGNLITSVNVPGVGQQTQGIPSTLQFTDVRITETDDSALNGDTDTVKNIRVDKGTTTLTEDNYSLDKDRKILTIGDFVVVPESIKLTVGDSAKIIITGAFDDKVDNDEAQLKVVKTEDAVLKNRIAKETTSIVLEKALTEEEAKTIKLEYAKKDFTLTTREISGYLPAEEIVVELNGKMTTLQKALNRANFAYVTTNLAGEIVHMNAIYKELEAKFVKANKNMITFQVVRNDIVVFTDTIALDAGATVQNKSGAWTSYSKIKPGSDIVLTVDPGMGYKITYLQVK